MRGRVYAAAWIAVLGGALWAQSVAQAPAKPKTKPQAGAAAGAGLQFLGSVAAPKAIEATETGHTNGGPAAPAAAARLAEATSGAGRERDASGVARAIAAGPSGAGWFAIGAWALARARADSGALAREPAWSRRLRLAAARHAPICGAATLGAAAAARGLTPEPPAAVREAARDYCLALRLSDLALAQAAASGPRLAARVEGVRALAAAQADEPAAAARHYRAGLALDPENAALHAGLGELARERRDWATAVRELGAAHRLDPGDALAAFELGDATDRLGHRRRALALLDRALRQDPKLLLARWSRARVEAELGQTQAAVTDYVAAASVDDTGELQYQLARVYRKLGEAAQAKAAERRSEAQRAARRARPAR